MTDFAYYCVFGPNKQARVGFAKLVLETDKRTLNEDLFKEYFGMDYDQFHKEMYDFYKKTGQGGAKYRSNAWGPSEITVWRYDSKDLPKPVVLRDADRNQSARIISDWFALNKRETIARGTLLLAREDAPSVMKDMEFAATLGLIEAQSAAGDKAEALKLLEQAAGDKVGRPRVYRELSRLRLENIKAAREWGHRLDADETKAVLEPLFTAMKIARPDADSYLQILKVVKLADVEPPGEFLEAMAAACRQFPGNIELLGELVPVLLKRNMQTTAASLIENASKSEQLTDNDSDRLERLREVVAAAAK